jgi:endonuclease/exonuclease/phosphatase (EEP) superfamily protein YafD
VARQEAATPRAARRHGLVRGVLTALGWLAVAVLALTALGRLTHLDDALAWPYSAVNALTPIVYLPAYGVFAAGLALRRSRLALAALPLIALQLYWTMPQVWPGGAPEHAPAGSVPVRLLAANLEYTNDRAGRLGAQIDADHPDIVVLVEVSPRTLRGVTASGALTPYPYRVVHPDAGAFGYAVYSRFALSDFSAPTVDELPLPRMTVTLGGGQRFLLFAVHTLSPTSTSYTRTWRRELDHLAADIRAARLPVVLAGDFNATQDHRPFTRLLDAGVRDAHDVTGTGWQPTWPADKPVPPVIRIDHVLASPAFAVTGYRRGGHDGSDHLPVIADLALRPGS